MALPVTLRKRLFVLLTVTVFSVVILCWNQDSQIPVLLIFKPEKSMKNRATRNVYPIPSERTWTYICEHDKCVRRHFLTSLKNEKRIPFLTCSMTCGDINIWPLPKIATIKSSKSVRFTVTDLELKIKTNFPEVGSLFCRAFDLFIQDLRHIQRLNNSNDDNSKSNSLNLHEELLSTNNINNVNLNSQNINYNLNNINYLKQKKQNCDIDSFIVDVIIKKSNQIHLNFDTDESYNIKTNYENHKMNAIITANSFFGARHALSTLQQLIWYDDEDDILRVLTKIVIIDSPKFKYRGLMLDTSRHYFSVEAIKRTLAGMSYSKLNRFHWHITDSQSFPFISKYYPELAAHGAYSERETYTSEDVKEIVAYARLRGVQVIPEIDAPAHAGNGWEWGPKKGLGNLSLCINKQPWSVYCGEPPCGQLNPKNNNTFLILQKLYEELLNLTGPTDYFHLGGDEVNKECWKNFHGNFVDMWCDFMLEAANRLQIANNNKLPKYITVWSSDLTNANCLDKSDFVVQVWGGSNWLETFNLLVNGYNIIISHVDAWYLDCGFGTWRQTGEGACSPYHTWQDVYKHRPWELIGSIRDNLRKQILGGEACLWTEQVDESILDNRLWPRAAALGERLWSDPKSNYDDHDNVLTLEVFRRMSVFRNRLIELGLKAEPIFPKYCSQNPDECT